MMFSMRSGLAVCVALLALAGPAAGQEIRPTLDKIKETSVIQLGYREASRPFSFRGSDGQPAGFSVDLCLQVAASLRACGARARFSACGGLAPGAAPGARATPG